LYFKGLGGLENLSHREVRYRAGFIYKSGFVITVSCVV